MWEGKVSDSNNLFKRHMLDPCEIQKLVAEVGHIQTGKV